ncbi:MAG: hypothetical protein FP826_09505, partial [Sphingomonadales bacterium]|nr:hypothetical protein [Sphingomonadales bacterium]
RPLPPPARARPRPRGRPPRLAPAPAPPPLSPPPPPPPPPPTGFSGGGAGGGRGLVPQGKAEGPFRSSLKNPLVPQGEPGGVRRTNQTTPDAKGANQPSLTARSGPPARPNNPLNFPEVRKAAFPTRGHGQRSCPDRQSAASRAVLP